MSHKRSPNRVLWEFKEKSCYFCLGASRKPSYRGWYLSWTLKDEAGFEQKEDISESFHHVYELVKVVKISSAYYTVWHPVGIQ